MKRNFKFNIADEVTIKRWTKTPFTTIYARRFLEDKEGVSESYMLKGFPFWFGVNEIKLKSISQ